MEIESQKRGSNRVKIFRLCLSFTLFAMSLAQSSAAEKWLYGKSDHFEVYSSASERDTRTLVEKLERFRRNFLRTLPPAPFHDPRTTLVIFGSDRGFEPFKPRYKGKVNDVAGYFQGMPDEVVIALSADRDMEQTIPVIYHEYVHLLMHSRGYRLPPWLNEGLAELYSTFDGVGRDLMLGRPIIHHLAVLSGGEHLPINRLFAVTQGSPDYNESERRSVFYAQSWALVHYWLCGMAEDKEHLVKFEQFLTLLQIGHSPDASLREAYGLTQKQMEAKLETYVRRVSYIVKKFPNPEADLPLRLEMQPASDFERDLTLASLRWRIQQSGDTAYRMLEFAEKEPSSPRPHEVLAALAMVDGEQTRAVDYWRKAAELGSGNAFIYQALAAYDLQQWLMGVSLNFRFPEKSCAELRGWLDRAIALSPEYAEAWDWLALTEAFAPKVRAAVIRQIDERRKRLREPRPRLSAALALIAYRQKMWEYADNASASLLKLPDVLRTRKGTPQFSISGGLLGAGKSSWMQAPDYFPEVLHIAEAIQREVKK